MRNVQQDQPDRECSQCGRTFGGRRNGTKCHRCQNTSRACTACGKTFLGHTRRCSACATNERTCVACGRISKMRSPKCYSCLKTERECAACGTSYVGAFNKCQPCRNADRRERLGIVKLPPPAPLTPEETWRSIPGYEGLYLASSEGRVRSLPRTSTRGGVLRTYINSKGYHSVNLTRCGRQKTIQVHCLVAMAFLGTRPAGFQVRHLNGNPGDNRVSNLAYGTPSQNMLDAVEHGTNNQTRKTHCPSGHPYDDNNTRVIPSRPRARYCKACNREQSRKHEAGDNSWRPRGEAHHATKLTTDQVAEIRMRYKPRVITQRMLADEFGVSKSCIGQIASRRNWAYTEDRTA